MLIPKNKVTEPIDNPIRPKIGIRHDKRKFKASLVWYEVEEGIVEKRLMLDYDMQDDTFHSTLLELVPKKERHICNLLEVVYIPVDYKAVVVDLAKNHFDEVETKLRTWD